jgi:phosphatidylserine/phosphatidylglycerophosphate/cardiolipin synthase-like enzyme
MMSKALIILIFFSTSALFAQSIFFPENGKYVYTLGDIEREFQDKGIDYLRAISPTRFSYKLDKSRNEYQIKDWFLKDWYDLQDMFFFDPLRYINSQNSLTFNEAKRRQYSRFAFSKKHYFHFKTVPSMKEWGGLTHPPLKKLSLPLEKYHALFGPLNYKKVSSLYFSPSLQVEIDQVSHSELSFNNVVVPLPDRIAFEKKKSIISKARESILMSSLVFICDTSTRELVNLLIGKHREGVDVKILVDGFVGKVLKHTECLKIMRNAGIEVVESKDFFRHKLKALYHTKTLVVDFSEAVAGGHNMIDADNTSRGTDFKNRDLDLYIKGPMVTDVARQFIENWTYQAGLRKGISSLNHYASFISHKLKIERRQRQRGQENYQRILGDSTTRMRGVCRFIKQAPYEDRHTIGKAYLRLLNVLDDHLVIADPIKSDSYVGKMSDAPLLDKLDNFEMFNKLHLKVQHLARRGKKIDYITTNINMAGNENVAIMNDRIRSQLEAGKELWANWSLAKLIASNSFYGKPHYHNLMKDWLPLPGVHIWKHMSFLHTKVFYFDRIVASVGSYNFQHNATDQAYESTAICMDESLNHKLDVLLIEDMANSIPLIYSSLR